MIFALAGGGGKTYALIVADWPSGSTCQVVRSGDGKTLEAKGTSGHFVFNLPKPITVGVAETWTVSCTNGILTSSKTVQVSEGQSISVALSYTIILYNSGVFDDQYSRSDITTNCTQTLESTSVKFAWGNQTKAYGYLRWIAVDLTSFSRITLRGYNNTTTSSRNLYFTVWISQDASATTFSDATDATHVSFDSDSLAEVVLDVTNRSGVWYVAAGVDTDDSQWTYGRTGSIYSVIVA